MAFNDDVTLSHTHTLELFEKQTDLLSSAGWGSFNFQQQNMIVVNSVHSWPKFGVKPGESSNLIENNDSKWIEIDTPTHKYLTSMHVRIYQSTYFFCLVFCVMYTMYCFLMDWHPRFAKKFLKLTRIFFTPVCSHTHLGRCTYMNVWSKKYYKTAHGLDYWSKKQLWLSILFCINSVHNDVLGHEHLAIYKVLYNMWVVVI